MFCSCACYVAAAASKPSSKAASPPAESPPPPLVSAQPSRQMCTRPRPSAAATSPRCFRLKAKAVSAARGAAPDLGRERDPRVARAVDFCPASEPAPDPVPPSASPSSFSGGTRLATGAASLAARSNRCSSPDPLAQAKTSGRVGEKAASVIGANEELDGGARLSDKVPPPEAPARPVGSHTLSGDVSSK